MTLPWPWPFRPTELLKAALGPFRRLEDPPFCRLGQKAEMVGSQGASRRESATAAGEHRSLVAVRVGSEGFPSASVRNYKSTELLRHLGQSPSTAAETFELTSDPPGAVKRRRSRVSTSPKLSASPGKQKSVSVTRSGQPSSARERSEPGSIKACSEHKANTGTRERYVRRECTSE